MHHLCGGETKPKCPVSFREQCYLTGTLSGSSDCLTLLTALTEYKSSMRGVDAPACSTWANLHLVEPKTFPSRPSADEVFGKPQQALLIFEILKAIWWYSAHFLFEQLQCWGVGVLSWKGHVDNERRTYNPVYVLFRKKSSHSLCLAAFWREGAF